MTDNKQNPQQEKRIPVHQHKQSDNPEPSHSQTVGKNGPTLEQDNILHETLETFIHEKIVERPVHVKGYGAFGHFETLNSMSEYTKLPFLQQAGQTVPVAVRFSLGRAIKALLILRETYVDFQRSSIQMPEFSTLFATISRSFCCAILCVFQRVSKHYHHHHETT